MMKSLILFLSSSLLFVTMSAMQEDVAYRLAGPSDVQEVVQLINEQAFHDSDKIVILPKLFREPAMLDVIEHKKIFIATIGSKVIGYKKLYLMDNDEDRISVLRDEIRCISEIQNQIKEGLFDRLKGQLTLKEVDDLAYDDSSDVVIYNGADFTSKDLRGQGINSSLTKKSFEFIKEQVVKTLHEKKAKRLILAYGLTNDNESRNEGIAKLFSVFLKTLEKNDMYFENIIFYYAYRSFKPSFDENAQECIPLPDDQSIEGAGNVLVAQLVKVKEEK